MGDQWSKPLILFLEKSLQCFLKQDRLWTWVLRLSGKLFHVMLCYAMLCYAMLCCAVLCCAVLCLAILWYDMIRYDMFCYVILCYIFTYIILLFSSLASWGHYLKQPGTHQPTGQILVYTSASCLNWSIILLWWWQTKHKLFVSPQSREKGIFTLWHWLGWVYWTADLCIIVESLVSTIVCKFGKLK